MPVPFEPLTVLNVRDTETIESHTGEWLLAGDLITNQCYKWPTNVVQQYQVKPNGLRLKLKYSVFNISSEHK